VSVDAFTTVHCSLKAEQIYRNISCLTFVSFFLQKNAAYSGKLAAQLGHNFSLLKNISIDNDFWVIYAIIFAFFILVMRTRPKMFLKQKKNSSQTPPFPLL